MTETKLSYKILLPSRIFGSSFGKLDLRRLAVRCDGQRLSILIYSGSEHDPLLPAEIPWPVDLKLMSSFKSKIDANAFNIEYHYSSARFGWLSLYVDDAPRDDLRPASRP